MVRVLMFPATAMAILLAAILAMRLLTSRTFWAVAIIGAAIVIFWFISQMVSNTIERWSG